MNEPLMVIQTTLFRRDDNYWVVYVLTAFLQSIVYIYIETDLPHFWSLSDRKQLSLWPLLRKKNYTTVYFPWILHSATGKFRKIIPKCFLQVFKGFNYYMCVFRNIVFLMNLVIFQPNFEPVSFDHSYKSTMEKSKSKSNRLICQ